MVNLELLLILFYLKLTRHGIMVLVMISHHQIYLLVVQHGSTPSNWVEAQTGVRWVNGTGVYSDVPDTIATQHFDKGNENIEIDITDYVNGVLAGDVNYGLGILTVEI
jgi:hypothetical protein